LEPTVSAVVHKYLTTSTELILHILIAQEIAKDDVRKEPSSVQYNTHCKWCKIQLTR